MEEFESCSFMICNTGRSHDYIFDLWGKNSLKINYIHRSENEELPVLIALVHQENITDKSDFLQVFLMKSFTFVGVFFGGLTGWGK